MNQPAVTVPEQTGLSHSIEAAALILLIIATIPVTLAATAYLLAGCVWRDLVQAWRPPDRCNRLHPAHGRREGPRRGNTGGQAGRGATTADRARPGN